MDKKMYSQPLSLRSVQVSDAFWKQEMELVRKEVIPYQWEALNDRVEGAAPSYAMRNFRVAAKKNQERRELGAAFQGFETLSEELDSLEDRFYGCVFQDSDFSKWIEAVGYSLNQHPDPELERIADGAIDLVCAAQQEDGYLDTYYIINGKNKIFTNLRDHHELYCMGHLIEGAVAYYEATGKDKLLKAAARFADYAAARFGTEEGKKKGYPGHEIAEMALVRLYDVTGEQRYLELSKYFIEERGKRPYYFDKEHPEEVKKGHEEDLRYAYNQAHLPVRQQEEAVGHSVRAVYLYSGMADIARITGDETLYASCKKLWDSIAKEKCTLPEELEQPVSGESFSYPYDLPNDTAYAETCASIGLVFFARRMLEIHPDGRYANVMERALYNGILSGMALDGKSFFYVNPLEVVPEACHKDERKFHVKPVRQKWFGCACCPPNLARLISSIGAYGFTENEDTLFVHLYMGSTLTKKIGEKEVQVELASEMPWNGEVEISVNAQDTPFVLALRIPDWCDGYTIDGADAGEMMVKDGYLYLKKPWGEKDVLKLHFSMPVRLMEADEKVREDAGKAALMRGPIVYCLEEADNGKNLHLLKIDPDAKAEVVDGEICGIPVKEVEMEGYRVVDTAKTEGALYHIYKKKEKQPVKLKFIPYYTWANRGENEMEVWVRI